MKKEYQKPKMEILEFNMQMNILGHSGGGPGEEQIEHICNQNQNHHFCN